MTDELPPGWALATVGDVAHFVRGVTYSKEHAKKAPAPGSVGILRATNIGDGLNFDDLVFVPERFVSDEQIVRDGDVVLAMSSGSKSVVGKAAIARSPQRCGFGAFCGVIRPSREITPSLLAYYFQTKAYRNAVSEVSKGSNINNLKAGHILERPLPIPPTGEQQRIASKIDELFSRIDEGERALERVSVLVERYRQSVLKAAVTGELTRGWREKNKDKLEPGEALLARILTARREAWEQAELEKMKAKGITPANDKWKQKYEEPAGPQTATLPELPEGWCWTTIDALCFVTKLAGFEYTKFVQYTTDGDLAVIKAENAGRFGFKRTKFSKVRSASVTPLTRSVLKADDLLMVFVGAGTGNVARVPSDQQYFLGPNIAMARVESTLALSAYLEHYLRSPLGRGLALGFAKAVAQPSLSMGTIRKIPVAVPPVDEQALISDLVTRGIDSTGAVRLESNVQAMASGALRQAVLKAAFDGALVSQDPADEPASALLERIAAERNGNSVAPTRGSKKKNTA